MLAYSSGDEGWPESSADSSDCGEVDWWGVSGGLLKLGRRCMPVTGEEEEGFCVSWRKSRGGEKIHAIMCY